ncbi:hypothetical protein EJ08DRAFT_724013 [Tothia fuscella]|uniref:Uncharacterized protein n=1 Tax=Tothia fuscella TaxID=1048955 RepID=A0A9P4P002_9PEZI|nr:hypothetical protein EJ08DRAFT_724013 [Tothia fuscella]
MFKRLFGEHGAKDVLTVFHKPNNAASNRVVTYLKQISANAKETGTKDQANQEHVEFNLDVQEGPPTGDQLNSLLEYVGSKNAGKLIVGARDTSDALAKLKEDAELFQRPVVVDWHQGKVAIGDNQSEILKLVKSIPKPE